MIAAFVLIRIGALTAIAPFLGGHAVPPLARMAIALGLTVSIAPLVAAPQSAILEPWAQIGAAGREAAIGATLGLVSAMLFFAARLAGRILDVIRGANLVESLAPASGDRSSPLGQLAFFAYLLVFTRLDGPRTVIEAVARSFVRLPIGSPVEFGRAGFELAMAFASDALALGAALTLPGLLTAVLIDLSFGLANRMAPSLNAFILALGTKAVLVPLAFAVGLAATVDVLGRATSELPRVLDALTMGPG